MGSPAARGKPREAETWETMGADLDYAANVAGLRRARARLETMRRATETRGHGASATAYGVAIGVIDDEIARAQALAAETR